MVLEKTSGEPTLGRRIQSSSNRMQRLISQVLDMSRIDGGLPLGVASERLDLAAVAADLFDEARTAYPHVDFRLENRPGTLIEGDSGRLAQVLSNLLSNARHHGAADGAVLLRLDVDDGDGHAVLEVCNVGEAIADDFLPGLFDPFKRASMQNPRNRSGMGLGLYIAQQIVREHGGEIAYRHDGTHVIFQVRLPLVKNQGAPLLP
jgi:signal transduction histidine kinase